MRNSLRWPQIIMKTFFGLLMITLLSLTMLSHTAFAKKPTFNVVAIGLAPAAPDPRPQDSVSQIAAAQDVAVLRAFTLDEKGQLKNSFARGESILYGATIQNPLNTTVKAKLVFDATNGSTSTNHTEAEVDIAPTTQAGFYSIQTFVSTGTIPADAKPGKYTFTAAVTYSDHSNAKSSEFTVS